MAVISPVSFTGLAAALTADGELAVFSISRWRETGEDDIAGLMPIGMPGANLAPPPANEQLGGSR